MPLALLATLVKAYADIITVTTELEIVFNVASHPYRVMLVVVFITLTMEQRVNNAKTGNHVKHISETIASIVNSKRTVVLENVR